MAFQSLDKDSDFRNQLLESRTIHKTQGESIIKDISGRLESWFVSYKYTNPRLKKLPGNGWRYNTEEFSSESGLRNLLIRNNTTRSVYATNLEFQRTGVNLTVDVQVELPDGEQRAGSFDYSTTFQYRNVIRKLFEKLESGSPVTANPVTIGTRIELKDTEVVLNENVRTDGSERFSCLLRYLSSKTKIIPVTVESVVHNGEDEIGLVYNLGGSTNLTHTFDLSDNKDEFKQVCESIGFPKDPLTIKGEKAGLAFLGFLNSRKRRESIYNRDGWLLFPSRYANNR